LFAALNIRDGSVVAQFKLRHRHQEFLVFLRTIEAGVPVPFRRKGASPPPFPKPETPLRLMT
jgi:hypothetical protein